MVRKIKWIVLFNNLILFAPIAFIIRESKGLTGSEIFILQAILAITIVAFEVPSGVVTDKVGKKKILIISQILLVLSRMIFLFGYGFTFLVFDVILAGISSSLLSGTMEALVYESEPDNYEKASIRIQKYSTVGFIVSNIMFSLAVVLGYKYLILITLISNSIALMILFTLPKEESNKSSSKKEKNKLITSEMMLLFKDFRFWKLTIISTINNGGIVAFNFLFILLLISNGFKEDHYGWVILIYAVAELSVKYLEKVLEVFNSKTVVIINFIVLGSVSLLATYSGSNLLIISIGFIMTPLLISNSIIFSNMTNDYISEMKQSDKRVTILSLFNLSGALFEAFFFITISYGFESATTTFRLIGVLFCIGVIISIFLTRENSGDILKGQLES